MTHYLNSKGALKPIADMAYPHLTAAHAKLVREEPERSDEIAAIAAEISQRDAEYAAEQAVSA